VKPKRVSVPDQIAIAVTSKGVYVESKARWRTNDDACSRAAIRIVIAPMLNRKLPMPLNPIRAVPAKETTKPMARSVHVGRPWQGAQQKSAVFTSKLAWPDATVLSPFSLDLGADCTRQFRVVPQWQESCHREMSACEYLKRSK